jgi:glutamine amidotransferase-like uncharacterized protein
MKNIENTRNNDVAINKIRVALLMEEPLGWGSGSDLFHLILDGYNWVGNDVNYEISVTKIYDKDLINGNFSIDKYNVLLVPGGGVGDGEVIIRGFNIGKTKKWKKTIADFIKDGGGYVGVCGGAALITELITDNKNEKNTFLERLYDKSSIGVSCIKSYYNTIAFPIFYPFQNKYPEKVGAASYVFSFSPGETIDRSKIFTGGVPIDFIVDKKNPIFSDYPNDTERVRWWGGPAFIVPKKPDRDIKILARFPQRELSQDKNTRVFAWIYKGGIQGFIFSMFKALKFIKKYKLNIKKIPMLSFYFAGDWKPSDKLIELNFSNKVAMTAEVYPNMKKGRIILCSGHPEYMIWDEGRIEEVKNDGFHCIATGLHEWRHIKPLSKGAMLESTHTWWIVRRMVAWAAKVNDEDMPPVKKEKLDKRKKEIILSKVYWDETLLHQIQNI